MITHFHKSTVLAAGLPLQSPVCVNCSVPLVATVAKQDPLAPCSRCTMGRGPGTIATTADPLAAAVPLRYSQAATGCIGTTALAFSTGTFSFPANFITATTQVSITDSYARTGSASAPNLTMAFLLGGTSVFSNNGAAHAVR